MTTSNTLDELFERVGFDAGDVTRLRALHGELGGVLRRSQLELDAKLLARERQIHADRIAAIQTLTAGLAHEVRNPLNAAKLQLQLLERRLRKAGDDPRLLEPNELAQKEIARLGTLFDDFFAFACPPVLHRADHDVASIIRTVVEVEDEVAKRRQVVLAVVGCRGPLEAQVDAPKLHQVVYHLVRNAVEAVATNGHVTIELTSTEAALRLTVQDDGPGISDEVRLRVYEPFFSTKDGGTGLGMSIVHSLVALHGGSIELATSPRGTRFDVTIPRRG